MLPKELKIGGHTYKVLFPYQFTERTDIWGQHGAGTTTIKVADESATGEKLTKTRVWEVFLHEILHAIDAQTGHRVFEDNESAIDGIGEALYQVLNDNGLLKTEGW